tara:strand:+ start:57 stop:311 length:255 start_codon:yes stop_codon:yes gene_type:complete
LQAHRRRSERECGGRGVNAQDIASALKGLAAALQVIASAEDGSVKTCRESQQPEAAKASAGTRAQAGDQMGIQTGLQIGECARV